MVLEKLGTVVRPGRPDESTPLPAEKEERKWRVVKVIGKRALGKFTKRED